MLKKSERYTRRKVRVKAKIFGQDSRLRLSVYRTNSHIYAQIINDEKGVTLVSSSDLSLKKTAKMTKTQIAESVGEDLAKKAVAKKIKKVAFDRSGFLYHGRIKALAEGARKGGLEF